MSLHGDRIDILTRVGCCKSARLWLTAAHSNSTQTTDGCGVGHRTLLCSRRLQTMLTLLLLTLTTTTGLVGLYHQRQARTERSDVVACMVNFGLEF